MLKSHKNSNEMICNCNSGITANSFIFLSPPQGMHIKGTDRHFFFLDHRTSYLSIALMPT